MLSPSVNSSKNNMPNLRSQLKKQTTLATKEAERALKRTEKQKARDEVASRKTTKGLIPKYIAKIEKAMNDASLAGHQSVDVDLGDIFDSFDIIDAGVQKYLQDNTLEYNRFTESGSFRGSDESPLEEYMHVHYIITWADSEYWKFRDKDARCLNEPYLGRRSMPWR